MPLIDAGDLSTFYRLDGDAGRPVLVLGHSLGLDHAMWDAQASDLLPHVQVLRYDIRGHGATAAPGGDYRIEQLGRDVLALADALGIGSFAYCGLSLGGMIGLWLARHAPDRVTAVVLANTSPRVDDPAAMEARRRAVVDGGMPAVVETALGRFFAPATLAAGGRAVAYARRTLLATRPAGYAGCCAAIRDMDQRADLPSITTPALVVAGNLDVSMPWDGHSQVIADQIAGARLVRLPAAHLSNLERPRAFSAALLDFLVPPPADRLAAGFAMRRRVLGDAHVDRASAEATAFTRAFQDLITTTAWGTIWTRPGLSIATRRLLVLAITAALGRWEEFRLHVRTGLSHELEPCDLEEVLLQVAVYAGVPAANTAFHIAAEELQSHQQ